jgi:hypothetical protein
VPDVASGRTDSPHGEWAAAPPAYGFLINGASSDVYRAVVRLLDRECQIRVAMKPFTIGGHDYKPGALLLRNHENPDDLTDTLKELATDLALDIRPTDTALSEKGPDLGGQRFRLLVRPRIAIASQWPFSSTSFGSTWHLLDARLGLRVSPINVQSIGRIDLRRYNVIVLPHSWSPGGMNGVLSEPVRKRLGDWIKAGGTLIAMGNSAAFAAGKDHGLSSVRLRRDVLDKLAVYQEALKREQGARNVTVDSAVVWGTVTPASDDTELEVGKDKEGVGGKDKKRDDIESLKRDDAWKQLFSPRGVMLAASLDPEHWLCFGLPAGGVEGDRLPVFFSGRSAFMSKHPIRTPVRLTDSGELRLSGLVWPEARERLANTAYATAERVGYGQIILFASDPFFRGYLEGTGRLLLNALLFGPGAGTSQPVPW